MRGRLAALALALLPDPARAEGLHLVWPVACRLGETCLVQHYVDRDPGPGARDFRCGTLTYDAHNGTDIRLLTTKAQREGVAVLAGAPGKVLRLRDDAEDGEAQRLGRASVKGRECGNGLVVAHEGGFESQYCHMAKGSLVVSPGQRVAEGQPLGRIGLSGDTEFPHLHFTLRRDGKVVDPFALDAPEESCGGGATAWAPELRERLAYHAGAVLNAGFSDGPVTMAGIDDGIGLGALGEDTGALVPFARAIGLRRGDVQRLTLAGPDGKVLVDRSAPALESDKAQVMMFSGLRRPASGWPAGPYRAAYTVTRDGQVAVRRDFTVDRR